MSVACISTGMYSALSACHRGRTMWLVKDGSRVARCGFGASRLAVSYRGVRGEGVVRRGAFRLRALSESRLRACAHARDAPSTDRKYVARAVARTAVVTPSRHRVTLGTHAVGLSPSSSARRLLQQTEVATPRARATPRMASAKPLACGAASAAKPIAPSEVAPRPTPVAATSVAAASGPPSPQPAAARGASAPAPTHADGGDARPSARAVRSPSERDGDPNTAPSKRRRTATRGTGSAVSVEERRRIRTLKNRESAMRSLQKKAEYAAQLEAEEHKNADLVRHKHADLSTLVEEAQTLLNALDSTTELAKSASKCITRCRAALADSADERPS